MITENKLKHSIGVARRCESIARDLGKPESFVNACFVMGFLHDIGYEKCKDIQEHPEEGTIMINDFIDHLDACLDAIRNHGTKYQGLTEFDYILNKADLTVDHEGNIVPMEARIGSIAFRYGNDSKNTKDAIAMYKAIEKYEGVL